MYIWTKEHVMPVKLCFLKPEMTTRSFTSICYAIKACQACFNLTTYILLWYIFQ